MIIGWADITGKGKLTSQLCFMAGLFTQCSEKSGYSSAGGQWAADHAAFKGLQLALNEGAGLF